MHLLVLHQMVSSNVGYPSLEFPRSPFQIWEQKAFMLLGVTWSSHPLDQKLSLGVQETGDLLRRHEKLLPDAQ